MAGSPTITNTSPLHDGRRSFFYTQDLLATGGTPGYTFDISAGSLPPGLSITPAGIFPANISGRPTAGGRYAFTLRVTDNASQTATKPLVLTIGGDGQTINGYEVFQMCLGKDPEETITFAEYESDLGNDGHGVSVLYGSNTGRRRWKIEFPYLAGAGQQASVTANGMTLTPAAYVWDLFCRSKISGRPFVIKSARNDQYYLAKFADKELTYTRFITKLFAAQLNIVQARVPGVSVFDPYNVPNIWSWFGRENFNYASGLAVDQSGNGNDFSINGDIAAGGATQNGIVTQRFSGSSSTGYLDRIATPTIYEAMFIMKMRESSFLNNAGILTAASATQALVGASGTTKFANLAFGDGYTFRKNGVIYAESDQQAPMNAFGLVHCRWRGGISLANLRIGKNLNTAGTFAKMDLGEAILFNGRNPLSDSLELAEALMDVWNI